MTTGAIALPDRRATRRLGRAIAAALGPGDLVVLAGPLGSGKTFLVRAICRTLGVPPAVKVASPTFTLVHEYEASVPVVHADLYRLESARDVEALGLVERRDQGSVVLVEWGEAHVERLGGDALVVTLDVEPRAAHLAGTGPRSRELARRALAPA